MWGSILSRRFHIAGMEVQNALSCNKSYHIFSLRSSEAGAFRTAVYQHVGYTQSVLSEVISKPPLH
jgi:hypothetical protein